MSARHDEGVGFVTYSGQGDARRLRVRWRLRIRLYADHQRGPLVQHYVWDGHTPNLGVNPFNEPVRVGIDSHDTTVRAEVNIRLGYGPIGGSGR